MTILSVICILGGLFFLFAAAVGMIRLPDVFTRSHAVSLTDSLGAFLVLIGLALYQGFTINAFKILFVLGLLFLLNPVISHATIRAAHRAGLQHWSKRES